jgi:serine/threonine protein kinase/Tfp pilus assembly protein PilF
LAVAGVRKAAEAARVLALDQWRRWKAGERVAAEQYLQRFPIVADDPEAALDLIYGEWLVRTELGEHPADEEYVARFPEWAMGLRQQFGMHRDAQEDTQAAFPLSGSSAIADLDDRAVGAPLVAGLPSVPGYQIEGVLGRGGMGVVYKARHLGLKRPVALKMIFSSRMEELARFRIEAEAVARLQHPNIVQIYEVGERSAHDVRSPQPFLALEFVNGGTLEKRLAAGPLEPRAAAELVETLARAMHVAHLRGIVHRDLKPANVLLQIAAGGLGAADRESEMQGPKSEIHKISDFGLAKLLDTESGHTRTGDLLGTPRYMAPEQAQGWVRSVGPVTDVYSLGAILYHALTGKPPFDGATALEAVLHVVQNEPVSPRQLQPKLPRDLETICLKCLKKEGGHRYGSALELADDLRRFLRGEPIHARPVEAWERAAKWVRRRPALAGTVLASALIVIGSITGSIVHLNIALGRARSEWQRETDRAQRAEQRSQAQDLVLRAETAARAQDWQAAALHAAAALRRMGDEGQENDLRRRVAKVKALAEQQLGDRDNLVRFKKHRAEALSRLGLLSGGASPADLERIRTAARAGLSVFTVDPEAGGAVVPSANYTPGEKAAIVAGCYELLLVLADAEASPQAGQKANASPEQTRRAMRILERAARLGPVTQAHYRRLADYCARLSDQAGARRAADQAAAVPPAGALDYFLSGQERYQSGQFEAARTDFERALFAQPDHFWARYFQSLCQLRLHQGDAAVAAFTACLGQDQDFVWLYVLRALAYIERGDFTAAESDFDAALARQPDDDARYGIYVNRAGLHWRRDRPKDALADLREAVSLKPDHYQAHLNRAQIFRQQKAWNAAAEELEPALKKAPGLAALYRARAQLALDRGDTTSAQADFHEAILHEPVGAALRADDHVQIGRLLQRDRKHEAALEEYKSALQEWPDQPAALRGRGEMLLELRKYDEAAQALDRCLKVGPPSSELHRLRALARTHTRDYRGALDDYSRALELEPTAALYAHRGWLYLMPDAESFKLALQEFNQSISLDAADADAYAGRGFALAHLGEMKQAIEDARMADKLGPETPVLLWKTARIYSQVVARLEGTARGRDPELRQEYQAVAIRLISRALDRLPSRERPRFWKENIHHDKALAPLRSSKEFRNLENAQAVQFRR